MRDPFTFKSLAKKIQAEHGDDPIAAALDVAIYQGAAPGNLDSEVESIRKTLAVLGYKVVSEREYLTEIGEKLHDLASEAEYRAREATE